MTARALRRGAACLWTATGITMLVLAMAGHRPVRHPVPTCVEAIGYTVIGPVFLFGGSKRRS